MVTLGGTLLHFLYDWTDKSPLVAPFSGINESTWEHMKLLYWPMVVYAVFQWLFFRKQENFWCVKLAQILLGLTLIPVLFYTYNGAIGKSPDWVNIAIFYVSAAAAYLFGWWAEKHHKLSCKHPWMAITMIILIGIAFVVFTYEPPKLPLFQEPGK